MTDGAGEFVFDGRRVCAGESVLISRRSASLRRAPRRKDPCSHRNVEERPDEPAVLDERAPEHG